MNFTCKALYTFVLLSLSGFCADDTARLKGDMRLFYFSGDRDARQDREALALGGILKYTSPELSGLSASAAFFTSHDLLRRGSGNATRINNAVLVEDRSDIGGNSELVQSNGDAIDTLGEAYVQFRHANTAMRIGRQRLHSPLVNDYYNRFLPNSFEALWIENRDIRETVIEAGVVTRWKYKAEADFKNIAAGVGLDKKLYLIGVTNRSLSMIKTAFWFYRLEDAFDSFFAELDTAPMPLGERLSFHAASHFLKQNDSGDALMGALDTYLLGAKVTLEADALALTLMSDKVGDDTIRGSGTDYASLGWSQFLNYTDIQVDGEALNAGAFSYGFSLQYRFDTTYQAAVKYVHIDQDRALQLASVTPNKRPDSDEYNLDVTYKKAPFGQLRLRLAQIDYANDAIITNAYDEFNIRLIYDCAFSH